MSTFTGVDAHIVSCRRRRHRRRIVVCVSPQPVGPPSDRSTYLSDSYGKNCGREVAAASAVRVVRQEEVARRN